MTRPVRPSPNHGPRPEGAPVDLVVIHYTAMTGGWGPSLKRLTDKESGVSAHWLIGEGGECFQMVDESRRAWHAGVGTWGGDGDVNSRSVGIELSNDGASPFAAAQMDALEELLRGIMDRHGIAPEGVIGHSCSAPGRKIDPGPRFDWRRLARSGLAVWSDLDPSAPSAAPDETTFRDDARIAGFDAHQPIDILLESVRLRHRPWLTGPLSPADMAAIADVATRWPAAGHMRAWRSPLLDRRGRRA
ncbi:N-acetylmuramoyl-L-alanine amidase [Jannaschia sp. Os4]|uniref:N-acetylmuramoyl-L-alanine amidase n=1 Tax=Jannaschia sp. Os4 TaxID=2807617 RepID=UPI0031B62B8A